MTSLDRANLMERILTILPVGVWIMDTNGQIVYGNPEGQKIWAGARYVAPERFGEYKGWWTATGKEIAPEEWAASRAIRNGEISIDEEIEIQCFDGTHKILLNSAMPIRADDGSIEGAIIVNHDITERKHMEERLRQLAEHDPLTGAYNRRLLFDQLEAEIERSKRYGALSVLMFDVDLFKRVNDEHGHVAGDRVLAGIAALVRENLRGPDKLARYGGEEFVVIAPGIDGRQAAVLAERLRQVIAAAKFDSLPPVTCSFGACQFRNGDDTDALIRRADDLLYKAKQAGRNCVAAE